MELSNCITQAEADVLADARKVCADVCERLRYRTERNAALVQAKSDTAGDAVFDLLNHAWSYVGCFAARSALDATWDKDGNRVDADA